MCRLTEQVIFTDPYYAAPVNSHNPQIDELACALRSDQEAKIAASRLKVLTFLKVFCWSCRILLICVSATFETTQQQALTFRSQETKSVACAAKHAQGEARGLVQASLWPIQGEGLGVGSGRERGGFQGLAA